MNALQLAVTDTLDFLVELQRKAIQPAAARTRLQSLRERHPQLGLNLLSEREVYDDSIHYDALIRQEDSGTVSISYCPEKATPWPLLGVHRWNDADLLRVNGYVLKVDEAIAFLDFVWDEAPIAKQLINQCIIREELARESIDLSDDELQIAVDQFRIAKHHHTAEDTLRWLDENGLTHESFERIVADGCLIDKLRTHVTGQHVEETFRQRRHDFDCVRVASIKFADQQTAVLIAEQIRNQAMDFYSAAESLYAQSNANSSVSVSLFTTIQRHQLATHLSEQFFTASPGQLVGPIPTQHGFELLRVLSLEPAQLDTRLRTEIEHILFDEWLEQRRQDSRIEWCWGNARKTGDT